MPLRNFLILFLFILIAPQLVANEPAPENLDFFGGYYKNGEYLCYAEPCFTIHRGTVSSAARVRPFELRDWLPSRGDADACQQSYTRVLAETSEIEPRYKEINGCSYVVKGKWKDRYGSETINSVKTISIDQLVSFQEAHYLGGEGWSRRTRRAFMADPDNLIPVSNANKKLRAGYSASKWMPEDKLFWCDYVVRRDIIFRRYGLRIPFTEKEFNKRIKKLYCKY